MRPALLASAPCTMKPTILVLEHVAHERLGTFEATLKDAGCALLEVNIAEASASLPLLSSMGGIISMGGPMSVYERAKYPWISKELALLREAVASGLPVLGVCFGAQMLAAALGAKVTKNPQKEIGWYPVMREPGSDGDPLLDAFGQTETVFQWHGDTFALPKGAMRLASSPLCAEQGFRYGRAIYGLQFHVEVTEAMIRAWMQTPVNKQELSTLRGVIPPPTARPEVGSPGDPGRHRRPASGGGIIDPMAIRRQSPQHVERLKALSQSVIAAWCALVRAPASTPGGAPKPLAATSHDATTYGA